MSELATSPEWSPRRAVVVTLLVLRRATANFIDDRATQMAAGVSYFALISLFPLVLLAFSAIGLVLRDEELQQRVLDALIELIPVDAPIVEGAVAALASDSATIGLAALAGTIWAGSALAAALRNALNVAFEVERRRPFVQGKLIDFTVAPVLGVLLLASFVLTTAWRFAQSEAVNVGILRGQGFVWELGAAGIAGVVSFAAFLFLYWLLPNTGLRPRDLWPGALLAAIGFEAAKLGFAFYLANFDNYDVIYGSLGGLITLLVWVYVSTNIMLFGAEVAAELPHVLRGESRHGLEGSRDMRWRESALLLLRGLFFGPEEEQRDSPPRRWTRPEDRIDCPADED